MRKHMHDTGLGFGPCPMWTGHVVCTAAPAASTGLVTFGGAYLSNLKPSLVIKFGSRISPLPRRLACALHHVRSSRPVSETAVMSGSCLPYLCSMITVLLAHTGRHSLILTSCPTPSWMTISIPMMTTPTLTPLDVSLTIATQ